jgi:sec-independent protein translocase protein TatA
MLEGLAAPSHLIIVGAIFVLLFGAKRLPDSARALGQSMRILRTEVSGMEPTRAPAPPIARQQDAAYDVYTGLPLSSPASASPAAAVEPSA